MKIHFISIGGSVMHQLAIALKRKGYQITGTDDEIFEPAASHLAAEGLLPGSFGWQPAQISADLDAVILGMHAKADNPELAKAKELGLPIYSFPEYIFKESLGKKRVVIGGSHGKTTTTAMIMHVLRETRQAFDFLVGARLQGFDQSVNITDAPLIVCEGDEYPASTLERRPKFHFLAPHIAIITGIAWDHINIFPTFENYLEQFTIFMDKIEPGGMLIYNETDTVLADLVKSHHRTDITYKPYGVLAHEISHGETAITIDGLSGNLKVFGAHNLLNMHAAWLVCQDLGITANDFLAAISTFTGAAKRLEVLGRNERSIIFRDFAHAPSKLAATIEAVRTQFPQKRLLAVFELHTFSSLNEAFMNEYRGVMDPADEAVVFYSKHALELKRMPDLPKEVVKKGFGTDNLVVINESRDLEQWLDTRNYDDAVLLLMSSGNYDGLPLEPLVGRITRNQH
ncbi:MAG: UDP-N-acetylmuramate--L-alanine ligase [Flaviaesturariibacter sp.]|nr:UDP-N-acetylmuramate--L-alanine ligase [Flaviaesturariibacter sp.]